MIPLTVTARLSTPIVGVDRHPVMLDAPLAWAYAERAKGRGEALPPLTASYAADFPLPLERHDAGDTWVWCTSQGRMAIRAWTGVQVRRKPATDAMSRYAPDRKHHAGLGPYKARDTTLSAVLADEIVWEALVTDKDELCDLLGHVVNLGGRHRNDFGHVSEWHIAASATPDGWRDRPMPPDHPARAPYWHPSRKAAA